MANSKYPLSANQYVQEMKALPQYKQDILKAIYTKPVDPARHYAKPSMMAAKIARHLNNNGHQDLIKVCGRCGGTGLYNAHTNYRDSKGRPFCFYCGGSGVSLKKLSERKLTELVGIINRAMEEKKDEQP